MYCDQPSLLTRDPGGGVNEEIPHRWAKQPARNYIGYSSSVDPQTIRAYPVDPYSAICDDHIV